MFQNKGQIVYDFLKGKDWVKFEDIVLAVNLSRTKTKSTLNNLKYRKIVEKDDNDNWRTIVIPETKQVEPGVDTPSNTNVQPEEMNEDSTIKLPDQEPELQKKGINAKMLDIEKKIDIALGIQEKKSKKGKLKKLSINKIKRFNKSKSRAIILMGSDQSLRLVKGEYIAGNIALVRVNQNYYEGSVRYVWLWEGKQPVYVIPEWCLRPICAEEVYTRSKEDGTLIDSQIINLRAVKLLELEDADSGSKKKPNMMVIIGAIVAGLVVVGYLFFGGSK